MTKPEIPRFDLSIIGWREWISLPEFGIYAVNAKVDTGTRSSSLHAYDIEEFDRAGKSWVRFKVNPDQQTTATVVSAEAKVLDFRPIRSSSGQSQLRPVVIAPISLFGSDWAIELTLANRDEMGFRMLLGREAFRRRFLVDAGCSYLAGKRRRKNFR